MPPLTRIDLLRASRFDEALVLDARIAVLAEEQGGVVSRAQLRCFGLSPGGVDARVSRGNLHVVHRGVYAVGHPLVRGLGRDHAALLACGPSACRSHRTAALAWDLRSWSGRVEVTAGRTRRSLPQVTVHSHVLHPEDVTVLDGLPTTTVARTVFDLAEVLSSDQHEKAWQEGERLGLIDVRAVRAVAERSPGRRALAVIRPLLARTSLPGVADTRSPLEVDFLVFAAEHLAAFGPPQVNARVGGFEVDAYYAGPRVVVELDSLRYHDNDPAFERDRAKWNALVAAGEAVFPLTSRRLRQEPLAVAGQLMNLLAARSRVGRLDLP